MAACVVPSYILHHVYSYFHLEYQLRTLARVCKSWHHAALCMNCTNSNATAQDIKQWFENYFDTELVDLLLGGDFKSIIGAPHSYVVRNLVLHVLRDIQETVPNIEIEIFMLYSQLAKASTRSEKLLKVYQVSALLYLLRKLESTFNIYDIFTNVELALGYIKIPICRRDCLKLLVHVGAMLKYRFDQNCPHLNDTEFHNRAAIKCFDVKLLIKKSPPWIAIFELLEATIGPKFLRPNTVFPNFENKLVEICRSDFTDFNELLGMLESDLKLDSDEGSDSEPSTMNMPRIGITKFPTITNEFITEFIGLKPSIFCDRNHASPPRTEAPQDASDHDACDHDACDSPDSHSPQPSHTTPSKPTFRTNSETPSKYTTNNNNFTPNNSNNNPNSNGSSTNKSSTNKRHNSSTYATCDNPMYSNEQSDEIFANLNQHETTVIDHAATKTNNDESTACASHKDSASKPTCKRPVEDYKYYFASEENSLDDDEFLMEQDIEEFEDDEKENEPPAKFHKINPNTPNKVDVHNI